MFDVDRLIAAVCGFVILMFFLMAMVFVPLRPGLVLPVFLLGAGLCFTGDVLTSNHPAAALRHPMRWIRSLYLSGVTVGSIYAGWNYFDEASDVAMVGLALLGLVIGEFVLNLQVFSLLSRFGNE